MPRSAERKIISFSTTMRNPRRIGEFLTIIAKFENEILDNQTIMQIVREVLAYRLYRPNSINKNQELKRKFDNDEYIFSDNELNHICEISPQNHKEKGFEKGWESRFDTWYKLMSEFGFCYYAKNERILISDSAKMLINAYYDSQNEKFKDEIDENLVNAVFLNALSKYEVGNPYKKNLNHNAPLRLLLSLLKTLKEQEQNPLSTKEIPILLCWQNDDGNELFNYIVSLRSEIYKLTNTKFGYSDEFIYEKCLNLLESDNRTRFKINQITSEAVDEYIRKMRITGLISLRGNGRFIDINSNEIKKAEYILSLTTLFNGDYLDDGNANKLAFYNYMASIDNNLITTESAVISDDVKTTKLREFASSYEIDFIKNELLITCDKRKASTDELLRLIDKPLRLEFLTAIYLTKSFDNISIIPNYKSDDEGLPVFTASGGKADIVAFDDKAESYVEVSLIRDRSQSTNEMIPIERHLIENISNSDNDKEKFSIFIAPIIHDDAKRYAKFAKFSNKINISYYAINDFIVKVESSSKLSNLNDESLL